MKKICISKDWYLQGPRDSEYRKIDLPNDYIINLPRNKDAAGGGSNGYFEGGVGKYVKYFGIPDDAKRVILDVDGAYMCASVTFNERFLTMHPHGYAPFLVDLSDDIKSGTNKLEITTNALQPSTRWYSGGGLYRDVFLWTGGEIRIEPRDVFITTSATDRVHADITVTADKEADVILSVTISDADGNTVAKKEVEMPLTAGKTFTVVGFDIADAHLWEVGNGYLYTLTTDVIKDGVTVDSDSRKFGIRTLSADSKNGLLINGRSVKLRGGCIHHDHGVLGAADYPSACRRKLKKLQNAGFNAVRIAHNPPSLTLLELCDEMGILVMDEFFDTWRRLKGGAANYHLWFEDHWKRDIESTVLRDRDHPCVISYSIGNEIPEADGRGEPEKTALQLVSCTRALDNTRLLTFAVYDMRMATPSTDPEDYVRDYKEKYFRTDYPEVEPYKFPNWAGRTEKIFSLLDICGYNYLFRRYETDGKLFPERVIWGSETHALTFYDSWQKVKELSHVIGDFTWTAYDNLGEAGTGRSLWARDGIVENISIAEYPWRSCYQGDLDLCGFRRPQSYFREAVFVGNTEPRIFTTHPEHYGEGFTGTRWHWYDVLDSWTFGDEYIGKPVKCEVYTDADEIEWFVNGKSLGKSVPVKAIATFDIPYEKGEVSVKAYKNGVECGKSSLCTADAPAKIKVTPEWDTIVADNRDLCYFDIEITDKDGNRIPDSKAELTCITDGGELLGIFSGDPKNEDCYGSDKCHAFEGRAVAIVRTDRKGEITVRIGSKGLESGAASIISK